MKATEDDHIAEAAPRRGFGGIIWLVIIASLAALLLFWVMREEEPRNFSEQEPAVEKIIVQERVPVSAPDIPRRAPPIQEKAIAAPLPSAGEVLPVLPTPEEADDVLRSELAGLDTDSMLGGLIGKEHPVDVSAALIDGFSRGMVLRKILPLQSPAKTFVATQSGDTAVMDSANYERYTGYVDAIGKIDAEDLIVLFHTVRPLLERSYATLGLDPNEFDNAVIQSLDQILATPEIEGDIALERESVHYTYADPELESLPSLQKMLLRAGPDNVLRLKKKARKIREGLLGQ